MKKTIFMLAFMLIGSITFASISTTEVLKKKNSSYKEIVKVVQNGYFCIETHYVVHDGEIVGEFEIETYGINGECGVTVHWI